MVSCSTLKNPYCNYREGVVIVETVIDTVYIDKETTEKLKDKDYSTINSVKEENHLLRVEIDNLKKQDKERIEGVKREEIVKKLEEVQNRLKKIKDKDNGN